LEKLASKTRTGPFWVQCDKCNKWRIVPQSSDNYPDNWKCSVHPDVHFASCDVPQQALHIPPLKTKKAKSVAAKEKAKKLATELQEEERKHQTKKQKKTIQLRKITAQELSADIGFSVDECVGALEKNKDEKDRAAAWLFSQRERRNQSDTSDTVTSSGRVVKKPASFAEGNGVSNGAKRRRISPIQDSQEKGKEVEFADTLEEFEIEERDVQEEPIHCEPTSTKPENHTENDKGEKTGKLKETGEKSASSADIRDGRSSKDDRRESDLQRSSDSTIESEEARRSKRTRHEEHDGGHRGSQSFREQGTEKSPIKLERDRQRMERCQDCEYWQKKTEDWKKEALHLRDKVYSLERRLWANDQPRHRHNTNNERPRRSLEDSSRHTDDRERSSFYQVL